MSKNPEKLLQITKKRKPQDIVKCGKTKKTNSDIDFIVGEHEPTTDIEITFISDDMIPEFICDY